jgi:DNA-binding SARP family transcriptional activator
MHYSESVVFDMGTDGLNWSVVICMLGNFRLLKRGQSVLVHGGGKAEALLCTLALRYAHWVPRDTLLSTVWPESDANLARQSLNSLVYNLHKLLGDAMGDAVPVMYADGYYRLNLEAGVGVDVVHFEALAHAGEEQAHIGNSAAVAAIYSKAIGLYKGDLCVSSDMHTVLERERLRARYLTLLARLADYHYSARDYISCLDYAQRLLDSDPSREDAHRLVMRCYVQLGERAQALRHYRLCQMILHAEFDAVPEPATTALFDQIRREPGSI